MRLQLHDPEGHRLGASVINPSVLVHDGAAVVVARRHRRETRQRNAIYDGPEGSGDAVTCQRFLQKGWGVLGFKTGIPCR